jgi:hypothetical protein
MGGRVSGSGFRRGEGIYTEAAKTVDLKVLASAGGGGGHVPV